MNIKNKLNLGLLITTSILPNLQSDPSKLEPIYLASVALYLNDEAALRNLPFVSKNGQEAFKMLKKNPITLTERNRHLFPNIETQVLFSPDDKVFTDGIQNHVYGYPVDYDFFLQNELSLRRSQNADGTYVYNIPGIVFTKENRINHSGTFQQPIPGTIYFKYDIPPQITSLDESCFSNCNNLQEITIPRSVSSLGDYCFADCWRLTTINIPEVVSSLGKHCFAFCHDLQEIIIPNSVSHLGGWCFMGCRNLREIIIPNSVPSLDEWCFDGCISLQNIIIPDSVSYLGEGCFNACTQLQEINIPNSVSHLGNECFSRCENLQEITISDNIEHIGESCFDRCNNLRYIYIIDTGNGNAENVKAMLIENLINSGLNPDAIQITIIPQQQ